MFLGIDHNILIAILYLFNAEMIFEYARNQYLIIILRNFICEESIHCDLASASTTVKNDSYA